MNSLDFVHRWYMPFIWFTVASVATSAWAVYTQMDLVTVPGAEIGAAHGAEWVVRDEYLETIVPYLFALVAGVWLIDGDGTTRWAAFWALLAGIARIAAPLWIVTVPDVTAPSGVHYIDWETLRPLIMFADIQMILMGVTLWALFGHFAGSGRGFSAHHEPAY